MENNAELNYQKNAQMLEKAFSYCNESLDHKSIINVLSGDDNLKKQLCIIELKTILSASEAAILVSNLTGKPGPVRETASYKILELIQNPEYTKFFQTTDILDTFVKAVTDINPCVSRNTVEIIKYADNSDYLYNKFISEINKTLSLIDSETKGRSYVLNKKNFNLYWNLEAINSIIKKINPESELTEILNTTSRSNDYTIREKTALIISKSSDIIPGTNEIRDILASDSNIYVRNYIISKHS